jgi:16S rRNA G966 N2-methylase RsmD
VYLTLAALYAYTNNSATPTLQIGDTNPQTVTAKNQLYYGDNYEVLQRYIKDESVDLIYLDPPFNSRQDYNVLFAEKDGSQSSSQIHAFEDTWEWNIDAQRSLEHIIERGGRVADAMRAFHFPRRQRP